MNEYPINSRVSVYINRHSQAGLLGKVDHGPRAIIRRREIAWQNPKPLEDYVNQTRDAIVLHYDSVQEQLELSLRLVERDPWKKAITKYALGKEVQGKVVGLIEEAAFVELEPGIEAFLPLRELPLYPEHQIEDSLWIHDNVRASVVEILPNRRRLRLSTNNLLAHRENRVRRQLWTSHLDTSSHGATLAEYLPKEIRLRLLRIGVNEESLGPKRGLRALIIEDDEAFAAGIQSLLRCNGCQVVIAKDSMTGIARAQNHQTLPFDLIIVDWNLPKLKGHIVVQELQLSAKQSRVILILDPIHLQQHPEIRDIAQGCHIEVISKSDGESLRVGLISILRELQQFESHPNTQSHRQLAEFASPTWGQLLPEPADASSLPIQNHQAKLQTILSQLESNTQATTVSIMRLDPGRSSPVLEAYSGKPISLEHASPDIIYSPLEDVLQQGLEVLLEAVSSTSRLERLQTLLPFRGFLGIPIPTTESSGYGLILFKEDHSFTQQNSQHARTAAYLISQIIQERRLIQIFQPWQSQNLIGQLSSSIVHEVNNKLGGIELLVQRLGEGLKELARWPEKAEDATFLRELEEDLDGISRAQKAASELRNWYLGLTAIDEQQPINLRKLALEMMRALLSQAQELNVILHLKSPKQLPAVNARPSQLQQIFVNLILNAIQQMAEVKRTGKLTIEISYVEGSPLPLQVRFKDEGPGIHYQLWSHIFDFGFTTKKTGAGLGLTIARQAAIKMGGQLRVETSHMFWGTSFLLELPRGG